MDHRTIAGTIRYTSKKPERLDQERGREHFRFTVHPDGRRTMQAHCEIEEPAPTVLRDITYSIDANGRPEECFVRLTVGGSYMGSGWFLIRDHLITCESQGPTIGRLSQTLAVDRPFDGFGTHPIAGDAYLTTCMDIARGPHKRAVRVFFPSPDHRGATPPMIAEGNVFLKFLGEETVSVAAGTFACRRFRFSDEAGGMVTTNGAHPLYEIWVTADDDAIFVQGGVGGYMQTWYELAELTRAPR